MQPLIVGEVGIAGAWEVITWEVLKTGLCTIACLKAGFVYWYVGMVVTFKTLTGGTETVLRERFNKTTLSTLWWTLTVYSLKWVTEAL